MDVPASAVPRFDSTIGAIYLGSVFASVFFGITSIQTYLYFDNYRDGLLLMSLVGLLWLLDAVHLVFAVHAVYYYSVTNFANPANIQKVVWSILAINIISMISDTVVRSIYAYRIWILSGGTKWIVVVTAIPSLLMIGTAIVDTVREAAVGFYTALNPIKWDVCLIFGSSAIADIIIAATLCTLFWQRRSTIKRTQNILRIIMIFSVNTSVITSCCALAVLITFASTSDNFIFLGIYLVMPKLHLNSLLATLNARDKIREAGGGSGHTVSIPVSRLEAAARSVSGDAPVDNVHYSRGSVHPDMHIQVNTVVMTDKSSEL